MLHASLERCVVRRGGFAAAFARWALLAALLGVAEGGCGSADGDKNPSEVLLRFLEAMDRSLQHEGALKEAYALLDDRAQKELAARAERTSSLASRTFQPWEMIAQGRFRLRFAPLDHADLRTTVNGDRATVHVKDEDGRTADVPLVREQGHWRVQLALPSTTARPAAADPRTP